MTDDPIRAAFEAWHLSAFSYFSGFRKEERYADNLTQSRWDNWLAACRVARAAALEEAAQACDAVVVETAMVDAHEAVVAGICAARIRAMVQP